MSETAGSDVRVVRLAPAIQRLRHLGRVVTWLRSLPDVVADALLAALLLMVGVADMYGGPGLALSVPTQVREADLLGATLIVIMAGSLTLRRRNPMLVLAASGIGNIVYNGFGYPDSLGAGLPVLVALYSVAAHGTRRESREAAVLTALGMTTALFLVSRNLPGLLTPTIVIANYVTFATAWILGDNLRTRRAYVAELEERAARLEQHQTEEAERAVALERARIARELHDVVAHNVSVMTVQAGAARRVAAKDPDRAVETLGSIEEVGRQALGDMRRLLGVLRHEDDATDVLAPQPTMSQIDGLVRKVRGAGLPVELEVTGDPRELPAGVDLSAYRIVQEALTNALKHAGPATASVAVRYGERALDVEVVDDGRGAATALRGGEPGGQGILGMRERVALFGGELKVGPRPGGGFRVRAHLPYRNERSEVTR